MADTADTIRKLEAEKAARQSEIAALEHTINILRGTQGPPPVPKSDPSPEPNHRRSDVLKVRENEFVGMTTTMALAIYLRARKDSLPLPSERVIKDLLAGGCYISKDKWEGRTIQAIIREKHSSSGKKVFHYDRVRDEISLGPGAFETPEKKFRRKRKPLKP